MEKNNLYNSRKEGILNEIEFYMYKYYDTKKLSFAQLKQLYKLVFCSGFSIKEIEKETEKIFKELNFKTA